MTQVKLKPGRRRRTKSQIAIYASPGPSPASTSGPIRPSGNLGFDVSYIVGPLTVTWGHRNRVLQTGYLVAQDAASMGPEPRTT